jgi:hypothetical protein
MAAGKEDREWLISRQTEKIEFIYERALSAGITDPFVFVLDLRDPMAREIADLCNAQQAERLVAEKTALDMVPIWIGAMRRDVALLVLGHSSSPELVERVSSSPPPGRFWVVVYGSGGKLVSASRIPAPP